MAKPKELKATKMYEFVEQEKDAGFTFVSEYYLEGDGGEDNEIRVSKYRIEIAPDEVIYHTIIKEGHHLKNIIHFIHEHNETGAAEGS